MYSKNFNSLERDAIGEILNISLGASATAVSTMLSKRVDITTPNVSVVSYDELKFFESIFPILPFAMKPAHRYKYRLFLLPCSYYLSLNIL